MLRLMLCPITSFNGFNKMIVLKPFLLHLTSIIMQATAYKRRSTPKSIS